MNEDDDFTFPFPSIPGNTPILRDNKEKVMSVFQSLQKRRENDFSTYYQVTVDSVKVTPRTDNLDNFWEFLDFLGPNAEKLEIACFMGQSYRCTRYVFEVKRERSQPTQEEIDKLVREGIEKWKKEQEYLETKIENDRLRAKVEEQSETIKTLEAKVQELTRTNFDRDNLAVAQVLKHLIINYPKLIEMFPALKDFHGLFGLEIPGSTQSEKVTKPSQESQKSTPRKEPQKDG